MENRLRRKEAIIQRATVVRSVVAQLPLETEEGRKAAKVVIDSCRKSACRTAEEESWFDEIVTLPFEG